jgi:hypothetical protein
VGLPTHQDSWLPLLIIHADPEAKEELVNLLAKNSNRTATQQVSVTLFDNDDNIVGGPSLHDSLRAGWNNKDENEATLPSHLPGRKGRRITVEMIHEGTIDTKGEGLRIPKRNGSGKIQIGYTIVRFTGVTTTPEMRFAKD